MFWFSIALLFVSLVVMMREDYLYRAISIKYIVVFILAALLLGSTENHLSDWIFNSAVNIGLLIFLLLCTQVYYKLRFKQKGWFVDKVMGKGDLLFFMALGFVFSPLNFLMSLSFLSIISIVLALPIVLKNGVNQKLPLISYMGLGLIIEFIIIYNYDIPVGNDSQLISVLLNG